MILNYIIIFVLIAAVVAFFVYLFIKKDNTEELRTDRSENVYTVEQMTEFIKRRLDEITRYWTIRRRATKKKKQKI